MTRRWPGPDGLDTPVVGLGGGPLGNYQRAITDEDAISTVEAAWAGGIRYFDTAPFYGAGLAERRLGRALRGRPRGDYVLSTKVGRLVRPGPGAGPSVFLGPPTDHCVWDFSADGVRRSLDDSLGRLGVDRVDVVFIHDPYDHGEAALDEAYPALAALRAEGVVSAIGVGMGDAAMLARFVAETDLDVVMIAGRYTLLDDVAGAELLPRCLERGVSAICVSLFDGLLAGGVHTGPRHSGRAERVLAACRERGVPVAAAAMRFPLTHPAVAGIAIGCHTADQVRANLAAFHQPLPPDLFS
ncbi:aldo/keto reductase [Actinomycetes bacterium KLBMP 9797]